jgi:hypothetical protein
MSAAKIPMKVWYKVWVKAIQHATDMDGLVITKINDKVATRYEHWCGKIPKWVNHLRTWGESGTVKVRTDTTPKIADRGIQCMFVGHAKDHDGDCYDLWYPKTNRIFSTRDVVWLNKMYYNKENTDGVLELQVLEVDELEQKLIDPQDVAANPIENNEMEVDAQEGNTLKENMPYGARDPELDSGT